jgi:hypothetical protein
MAAKHAEFKNKPDDFFERKLKCLNQQNTAEVPRNVLRTSYEASYIITSTKTPHTTSEFLIMPLAIKVREMLRRRKYANEVKFVSV